MSWGPFRDIDAGERIAQLRSLRIAVRLLCGARGLEARHALLMAEITPEPDTLRIAEHELDRLPPVDRRKVLATFAAELPVRPQAGNR